MFWILVSFSGIICSRVFIMCITLKRGLLLPCIFIHFFCLTFSLFLARKWVRKRYLKKKSLIYKKTRWSNFVPKSYISEALSLVDNARMTREIKVRKIEIIEYHIIVLKLLERRIYNNCWQILSKKHEWNFLRPLHLVEGLFYDHLVIFLILEKLQQWNELFE